MDAVLQLHQQKEQEREQKAAAKRWRVAEVAWTQLLQALWMRVKLQRKYSGGDDMQPASSDADKPADPADKPDDNQKDAEHADAKAQKPAKRTRGAKQAPGSKSKGNQPEAAEPPGQAAAAQPQQPGSIFHMADDVEEF